jgi:hypothetical protein
MEKSSNELKDFFERNPKAYEMAEQTYQKLNDIEDMLKDIPEDRPAPRLAPGGSPTSRGLGTQARQRGILLDMKEKIEKDYETDIMKNYPELNELSVQKIVGGTKEYIANKRLEKENQSKGEKLKSDFSQSKRDIERGTVSKSIIDSLWSSRVGRGIDHEKNKDEPERGRSDKNKPDKNKDHELNRD